MWWIPKPLRKTSVRLPAFSSCFYLQFISLAFYFLGNSRGDFLLIITERCVCGRKNPNFLQITINIITSTSAGLMMMIKLDNVAEKPETTHVFQRDVMEGDVPDSAHMNTACVIKHTTMLRALQWGLWMNTGAGFFFLFTVKKKSTKTPGEQISDAHQLPSALYK